MERVYSLKLCGLSRELPIVSLGDDFSFIKFTMQGDTELIEKIAEELVQHQDFPRYDVDILVAASAQVSPLAHAMATRLQVRYVVAQESMRTYMDGHTVERSGEEFEKKLLILDEKEAQVLRGRNVCLVDGLVSSGETFANLTKLLEQAGATILCKAAPILEEGGYGGGDLLYLERLPVFSRQREELERAAK